MSSVSSTGKVMSKNVELVSQSDQGGRPDGIQIQHPSELTAHPTPYAE